MSAAELAVLLLAIVGAGGLGGWVNAGAARRRERRERTVSLLREFLGEPLATSRRTAWAFLAAEGDDVRPLSSYWNQDPAYGDPSGRTPAAELLRITLFLRTVDDLDRAGELDQRLVELLWHPHLQAWSGYTARLVARSAAEPDGHSELELFRWRVT